LGLDRLDEEQAFKERLKSITTVDAPVSEARLHSLWPEIDKLVAQQLHYARLGVGEGAWELFAEDGEMKMYRREEEINGNVVDPLKAVHTVRGVTGHEMCHYFFDPDVRLEWESEFFVHAN
jgi:collagen type IV alpha-3-binding protein